MTREQRIEAIDTILNRVSGLDDMRDQDGVERGIEDAWYEKGLAEALGAMDRAYKSFGINRLEQANDEQLEEIHRLVRSAVGPQLKAVTGVPGG